MENVDYDLKPADDNENHMLMLINCWILDHVGCFLKYVFRWFNYVCI